MKNIGILGSTGSIGRQGIDVILLHQDKYKIKYLSARNNVELLIKQSQKLNPEYVHIYNADKYELLKKSINCKNILVGKEGLLELCLLKNIDIALNAIDGYSGLEPTINIINSGTHIALANKESIVQAGHLITKLAELNNVNILPVDSEHSALWQCLIGEKKENIKKIILTASGGPFRKTSKKDFKKISKKQALNHPNWEMGEKITIDSATMMNKGFEMIEAYWLFNVVVDNIEIVVHPQSLVHSMIEFIDGSIKAQISKPDMRQSIQYAFSYPDRFYLNNMDFDFNKFSKIEFEPPNLNKFKCIKLAYEAVKLGGSYTTVLNVANDLAVKLFLKEAISFDAIPKLIEDAMKNHKYIKNPSLDDIINLTHLVENYFQQTKKI
tara:strand:+ start:279 stop:1424 length:1146 start_codon:yes stop_codon:yes gene_type:complete